jgi:CubicO group peptidase (beta-lactamase class C family)
MASFRDDLEAELAVALRAPGAPLNYTHAAPTGYWFGFRNESNSFTIALGASGIDSRNRTIPAKADDIIPAGSITKSYTAAAVIQLIEKGIVGMDDPVPPHIDPFLNRTNSTTMEKLWGANISKVTVRMLLNMRSGIQDYDDRLIRKYTLDYPQWDITPYDYLAIQDKKWACAPGTCSIYSSINYLLLGLLLCNYQREKTANGSISLGNWESLDQLNVIPSALRVNATSTPTQHNYHHTLFFGRGPCSRYPGVVQTYDFVGNTTAPFAYASMINRSCLNGFGFGNIGLSALDSASFYYDLLGPRPRIVSGRAALLMQQFQGWGTTQDYVSLKHHYGLGIWTDGELGRAGQHEVNVSTPGIWPYTESVGHGGEDYGTTVKAGFHPELRFGFAIMTNRILPVHASSQIFCITWRSIWKVLQLPGGAGAWRCRTP